MEGDDYDEDVVDEEFEENEVDDDGYDEALEQHLAQEERRASAGRRRR